MDNYLKPLTRRKFLKSGFAGGFLIVAIPLWRLFSPTIFLSDYYVKPHANLSKNSLEKLLEISIRYGSEFGRVYVKY